jgi:ribosomal protein L11 methyltransferase
MSTPEPRFPFLHVNVSPEDADWASSELFDLGASGVEERDETTLKKTETTGLVTLVASFETEEAAKEAMESLDPKFEARLEFVIGDAWRDAWKEHFRPFSVAPGIVVRPPWEAYEPKPGEKVLELEPGRAFGTGLHETTSLVCGALAARTEDVTGNDLLDVGTGSGILALCALHLGAKSAVCTDNDADVIPVVIENAERNGMADRITARACALSEVTGAFPVVVANIEARVLVPMAEELSAKVAKGGLLVLSGILLPQEAEVIEAYAPFTVLEAPKKGEWVAIVFRAPS